MSNARQDGDLDAMRMAEQTALKDEVYYWLDNVRFLVQGVLFRVPRLPFILGSKYFTEKHGLRCNTEGAEPTIHLQSVSATHFRVFLRFLFPMPSNRPIETVFAKGEWVTILSICTVWHFPEFRKLAIQNLDGKLTELELIHVGRALCIPAFVQQGYRAIIERSRARIITKEEATAIGHEAVNKLWVIRYQLQVAGVALDEEAVGRELYESFVEELVELGRYEEEGRVDEAGEQWVGVNKGEGENGGDALESIGPQIVQPEEGTIITERASSGAGSTMPLADLPGPPTGPDQGDMTEVGLGAARWGASSGEEVEPETKTEEVKLAETLRRLKGEEQEIAKEIREVQSRRLTLDATEKLEAVMKAKEDRLTEELKMIEAAKLDEEEVAKNLEGADEWSLPVITAQLDNMRRRRAELEDEYTRNEGKEHGQIVRWNKVGKKHKEKALVKLNAELLDCQRKQEDVETQLRKLVKTEKKEARDGPRTDESVCCVPAGGSAESAAIVCEEEPEESLQISERNRVLECELKRVGHATQTQQAKEAKLRTQEAEYSKNLAKVERLLSQNPESTQPKTIKKREKRQRKCTKNLSATQLELKEVRQLLDILRAERERLENERRML